MNPETLADWARPLLSLLADAALKGTLLLILAGIVAFLARQASAAFKHWIWFLAVAGLLLLPGLSLVLPGWPVLPRWLVHQPDQPGLIRSKTISSPALNPLAATGLPPSFAADVTPRSELPAPALWTHLSGPPSQPPDASPATRREKESSAQPLALAPWWSWLGVAYLAGFAGVLMRVLLGSLCLRRLSRRATPITDPGFQGRMRDWAMALELRRPVKLLASRERRMPMVWGLWPAKLLLPAEALDWTEARQRSVVLHELGHIQRWDCLTNLGLRLACAMYWYHPLVWLAARRLLAEQERACDDLVLNAGTNAPSYAEQLLAVAAGLPVDAAAAWHGIAMARPSTLENRLRAVLDGGQNRQRVTRGLVVAGVLVALGVAAALATLEAQSLPKAGQNENATKLVGDPTPIGQSASNALSRSGTAAAPPKRAEIIPSVDPSADSASEAPVLEILAWQDEDPDPLNWRAWKPNGLPVLLSSYLKIPGSLQPTVLSGHSPDVRYLHLWFSHPLVDDQSYCQVTLLDSKGRPVPRPEPGTFAANVRAAADPRPEWHQGWMVYALSPGRTNATPDQVNVVLNYSLGPWKSGRIIGADFNGAMALDGNAYLAGIGQTAEGKAFISLARDGSASTNVQFDFLAVTQQGRQLQRLGVQTTGPEKLLTERFTFNVPLAEVKHFQERTRPICTLVTYPGISLNEPTLNPKSDWAKAVESWHIGHKALVDLQEAVQLGISNQALDASGQFLPLLQAVSLDFSNRALNASEQFLHWAPRMNSWVAGTGAEVPAQLMKDVSDVRESVQAGRLEAARSALQNIEPGKLIPYIRLLRQATIESNKGLPPKPELEPNPISDTNRFRVKLPGDAEVKLVAVTRPTPDTPEPSWWHPDGSPWLEVPFRSTGIYRDLTEAGKQARAYEFVLRLKGVTEAGITVDPSVSSGGGSVLRANGQLDLNLRLVHAAIPLTATQATVSVWAASGDWKDIASSDPVHASSVSTTLPDHSEVSFLFDQAMQTGDAVKITLAHQRLENFEMRVVAEDHAGQIHPHHEGGTTSVDQLSQTSVSFNKLRADQVKAFKVQIRPRTRVDFRHVVLNPRVR